MTEYKDRSDWTSTDASGVTLTGSELVGVAWHWPGTGDPVIGVESEAATASRLRGYRNFHVTGRGWRDIGYNVAFDQAGRVWLLRSTTWGVNMVGAHCASASNQDANHEYAGALLILGNDERPSAAMLAAIADWYWNRFLGRWPGRTDNRGHGQVPGASTNCQGPHVRTALVSGAIPGTEDDMPPYSDWPEADRDALMADVGVAIKRTDEASAESDTPFGRQRRKALRATLVGGDSLIPTKADLAAVSEQNVAILAAIQGLDSAAILERIDQHHVDTVTRLEAADVERDQLRDLLEQHAEGVLDAAAVVEGIREMIHAGTAPQE